MESTSHLDDGKVITRTISRCQRCNCSINCLVVGGLKDDKHGHAGRSCRQGECGAASSSPSSSQSRTQAMLLPAPHWITPSNGKSQEYTRCAMWGRITAHENPFDLTRTDGICTSLREDSSEGIQLKVLDH